jgi:hypothetical protein
MGHTVSVGVGECLIIVSILLRYTSALHELLVQECAPAAVK